MKAINVSRCILRKIGIKLLSFISPYKKISTLDVASDEYAEYSCKHNGWKKFEHLSYLTKEYIAISNAFSDGYITCMHQNGLEFRNGLILKAQSSSLPYYMLEMMANDFSNNTMDAVESVLKDKLGEYNANEIMNEIRNKLNKIVSVEDSDNT